MGKAQREGERRRREQQAQEAKDAAAAAPQPGAELPVAPPTPRPPALADTRRGRQATAVIDELERNGTAQRALRAHQLLANPILQRELQGHFRRTDASTKDGQAAIAQHAAHLLRDRGVNLDGVVISTVWRPDPMGQPRCGNLLFNASPSQEAFTAAADVVAERHRLGLPDPPLPAERTPLQAAVPAQVPTTSLGGRRRGLTAALLGMALAAGEPPPDRKP